MLDVTLFGGQEATSSRDPGQQVVVDVQAGGLLTLVSLIPTHFRDAP